MKKAQACERIKHIGIIPAIRVSSAEDAHFAADAVSSGGIPIVEITMTVEVISHLAQHHPDLMVGAGTVLNVDLAKQCVDAGVAFLTSTGLNRKLIEFARQKEIAVLPGALTPTEVIEAWELGADFVKVFPCAQVGGESYIRALHRALPQIPLVAAGGVNQHSATNYILAGATAIGVGTELIAADRFTGFVREARRRLTPAVPPKPKTKTDFWKFHKNPSGRKSAGS